MAVEIQEPNDLPPNAITDDNADHFEILVYEQSQDVAGIKRLGIAGWKTYLGFNTHKVNNVANYLGIPNEFPWDSPQDETWEDPDLHRYTITHQVQALADKLGVSTEPQTPFPTILPRVVTLENQVQTPTTGLIDKMSSAEGRLDAIEAEIGSGTPAPSSLSGRIQELEDKVGQEASGGQPATRLMKVEEDVEASGTGLMDRMVATETNVTALQTAVNDPDTGLAKLNDIVQDPTDGLVKRVSDIESNVFKFCGNITDVDNPDDTTSVTIDGIPTAITDLNNGEVYNINPSGGAQSIKMTINGRPAVTYSKGQNVVWVEKDPVAYSYFDELAANIDVEEVNKIAARYGSQQIASNESYDVANLLTQDGVYQLTVCPKTGAIRIPSIIIITWTGGSPAIGSNTDIIKITPDNFSTYWEFNSISGILSVKSSAGNKTITFTKIGEV